MRGQLLIRLKVDSFLHENLLTHRPIYIGQTTRWRVTLSPEAFPKVVVTFLEQNSIKPQRPAAYVVVHTVFHFVSRQARG